MGEVLICLVDLSPEEVASHWEGEEVDLTSRVKAREEQKK